MMSLYEEARSRDLVDYCDTHLHHRQHRAGSSWMYFCPFHPNRRTEALSVSNGLWYCHVCQVGGDVIKLHALLNEYGTDRAGLFRAASELVGGVSGPLPAPASTRAPAHAAALADIRQIPSCRVDAVAGKHLEVAQDWLAGRGLMDETIRLWRLGVEFGNDSQRPQGAWWPGKMWGVPACARVVVPREWYGDVRGVQTRRVEPHADLLLSKLSAAKKAEIRQQVDPQHPESVTDGELKDALFGGRWLSWSGGSMGIYNLQAVMRRTAEGKPYFPVLPYVILTEGPFCALSLQDVYGSDGGYLAMAVKLKDGIPIAQYLRHVQRILIVEDRDEAGWRNARKLAGAINGWADEANLIPDMQSGRARIIRTPDPAWTDSNDVVRLGGPAAVRDWLSFYDVEPKPRKELLAWTGVS